MLEGRGLEEGEPVRYLSPLNFDVLLKLPIEMESSTIDKRMPEDLVRAHLVRAIKEGRVRLNPLINLQGEYSYEYYAVIPLSSVPPAKLTITFTVKEGGIFVTNATIDGLGASKALDGQKEEGRKLPRRESLPVLIR